MVSATKFVVDDYFYDFEKPEEKQMKRMTLSLICVLTFIGIALSAALAMADDNRRANATVSFGEWRSDFTPPLDRIVADPAGGAGNNHELIPNLVKIKAGGSVNFIISGGHIPTVYDDGTQPEDIDKFTIEPNCPTLITSPCSPLNTATPPAPAAGGVLSDKIGKPGTLGRIYRGAFLNLVRRDGVEVVKFTKPGTYLVICARKNHFVNDGMFGFVTVKNED